MSSRQAALLKLSGVAMPLIAAVAAAVWWCLRLDFWWKINRLAWHVVLCAFVSYCYGERLLAAAVVRLLSRKFPWLISVKWIALRLSLSADTESELVIKNFEWRCPPRDGLRAPYWLRVERATLRFSLRSLLEALSALRTHGKAAAHERPVRVHSLMFEEVTCFFEKDDEGVLNLSSALGHDGGDDGDDGDGSDGDAHEPNDGVGADAPPPRAANSLQILLNRATLHAPADRHGRAEPYVVVRAARVVGRGAGVGDDAAPMQEWVSSVQHTTAARHSTLSPEWHEHVDFRIDGTDPNKGVELIIEGRGIQ